MQVLEVMSFIWCCEWELYLWLSACGVLALFWQQSVLLECDGVCLSGLLKYFVMFSVASNSSAIWSGLLV